MKPDHQFIDQDDGFVEKVVPEWSSPTTVTLTEAQIRSGKFKLPLGKNLLKVVISMQDHHKPAHMLETYVLPSDLTWPSLMGDKQDASLFRQVLFRRNRPVDNHRTKTTLEALRAGRSVA